MNTNNRASQVKSVVQQTVNNATSWIGHPRYDSKELIGGQTFTAPSDGELDAIEVLASMVTTPGNVLMTLHSFDPESNNWGPQIGSANEAFTTADNGKWKSFRIPGLQLSRGKTYGFRLHSPNCYIGVAETIYSNDRPLMAEGQEWKFSNIDQKGQSFRYFSLAFKVDVRA
jgi:hypothetical protein